MEKYCFGIDVGGTTIKCGLFETDGTILDKWEIPTRTEEEGKHILPDIADSIALKMRDRSMEKSSVEGIGIGIPGPVRDGVARVAVNLHWGRTDVEGILKELTGLPVKVGNDANVAALGEFWRGGAEGKRNAVMVTLGTGVGGGVIVEGKLIEGSRGAGGEIGHFPVERSYPVRCNCGNSGCLEQFASATGIVRLAREELSLDASADTSLKNDETLSAKAVFDAYAAGDAVAGKIVERFAEYLGTALAGIGVVVDPEVIVIGGGVSKAGEPLIEVVTKHYREHAFSNCKETPIVLAELGNDAGIYGAARLLLD